MRFRIDDVAAHWDHTAHDDYDGINSKTNSYMRRFEEGYNLLGMEDGAYVLDAGCGTGNGIVFFSQRKKISGIGVDVSQAMLDLAQNKIASLGVPFKVYKQDVEDMVGMDSTFDAALSFEVLEHTPAPRTYLAQVYRMLKPGGKAVFTTPNTSWAAVHWFVGVTGIHHSEGPHYFIPRNELVELLTGVGFKILREKTSVMIPVGPEFLLRWGRRIEEKLGERWMSKVGLRRIFVVQK
ncbi:MAG: class I SAM-dependent methyltransferase [Acidobacteriota bacterium]